MKRIREKGRLIVIILIMLPSSVLMNEFVSNAQSFKLSAVNDMVRLFEDGYKLPPMNDSVNLFGIRGEIISGQFTINTKKDLEKVTVEAGYLKNNTTGSSLPASAVEWNFTGSIPLAKNTPNQPLTILVRQAPAKFPDYLKPDRQISIKAKTWQSVWLTIRIPVNAASGTYSGEVIVRAGGEMQTLPLTLTVYPLTIPSEKHLNVVEWYSTGGFSRYHGINETYSPEWFDMLRKYAENMVEHRQNSFKVEMDIIGIEQLKDGSFSFDFSRFDQIAGIFWNTGKMDYLETGFLAIRGEKGWSDTNFRWKVLNVKKADTGEIVKMPGKDVVPALVTAFEAHLREKGWLHKTWFHIMDEPAVHNSLSWIEFSRIIKENAPDLIRMDAIETTNLLNDIEIAVPKLDHFATWYDNYKEWADRGNELWFYTVGIYQGSLFPNKTIDMPLSDSRIMHWMNYKYGATGYLHWGWNQWEEESPYEQTGMHIGDGWHVYPVKDGVLNSMRWEQMRNGLQDYEYLWMLENEIRELKDSLGSRFDWIDPRRRGIEIAGRVIRSFDDRTSNPQDVYNAKLQLIKEIMDFNESPRIYIQTNPPELSSMTTRSSVEVFGWTEPGTAITINGQEIPVSQHGLFLEQFGLSSERNYISVRATKGNVSKEIKRLFNVK